jgi:hypothetical protein
MRIENIREMMEANKTTEGGIKIENNFKEGDVICIVNGISQTKSGITKQILVGRNAVVLGDSKKAGKLQVVLLDSKGNPQTSVVRVGIDEVVLVEDEATEEPSTEDASSENVSEGEVEEA